MGNHEADTAFNVLGYVGGGALSICLIPQLYIMHKTRSAADISVPWLVLYMFGLALSVAYLVYEKALAAWIPMLAELALTICTFLSKIYLDWANRREQQQQLQQQERLYDGLHAVEAATTGHGGDDRSHHSAVDPGSVTVAVPGFGRLVSRHVTQCPRCGFTPSGSFRHAAADWSASGRHGHSTAGGSHYYLPTTTSGGTGPRAAPGHSRYEGIGGSRHGTDAKAAAAATASTAAPVYAGGANGKELADLPLHPKAAAAASPLEDGALVATGADAAAAAGADASQRAAPYLPPDGASSVSSTISNSSCNDHEVGLVLPGDAAVPPSGESAAAVGASGGTAAPPPAPVVGSLAAGGGASVQQR